MYAPVKLPSGSFLGTGDRDARPRAGGDDRPRAEKRPPFAHRGGGPLLLCHLQSKIGRRHREDEQSSSSTGSSFHAVNCRPVSPASAAGETGGKPRPLPRGAFRVGPDPRRRGARDAGGRSGCAARAEGRAPEAEEQPQARQPPLRGRVRARSDLVRGRPSPSPSPSERTETPRRRPPRAPLGPLLAAASAHRRRPTRQGNEGPLPAVGPAWLDPQSQSLSRSYGSNLPTSLTYIDLSTRG
ncbi:serine/arginine repetitive matrix protein 1-like [Penaeus indicus]|uniref:serine/arginine repetitive matrix protein 1-like n=1 Tax=Penaeus indicus TaxID=29960 RepID=UPI00300D8730